MQLAAFLCGICVICGRITRKSTQSITTMKPQCLSQISLIIADKPQNPKTARPPITSLATTCLSLRDNAARCIPLRDLRNLRENNTQEDSIYLHRRKPQYISRRSRRWRRQTPKRQNNRTATIPPPLQPVFLCVIMQLAAFPLRNLRNLRENIHARGLNLSAGVQTIISASPPTH